MKCNGKSIDNEMDEFERITVTMFPEQIRNLLVGDHRASLVK